MGVLREVERVLQKSENRGESGFRTLATLDLHPGWATSLLCDLGRLFTLSKLQCLGCKMQ